MTSNCSCARMSKITNDGLTRSGTGCFIAVPYGNAGRERVKRLWLDVGLCRRLGQVMNTSNATTTTTSPTLDVIVLKRTRRRQNGIVSTNHRRLRRRPGRSRSRDRRDVTESAACTVETMHVSFAGEDREGGGRKTV